MRSAKFTLVLLQSGKMQSLAGYLFLKQVGRLRACLTAGETQKNELRVKQTHSKAAHKHSRGTHTHTNTFVCLSTVCASKVVPSIIRPS